MLTVAMHIPSIDIKSVVDGIPSDNSGTDHENMPSASSTPIADEYHLVPKAFSSVFPGKLYDLLIDSEINGLEHIISFQPHGRAFKVHRIFMFESIVLPDWFHQSNFSSFQRQLYAYGFRRVTFGPDRQAYYHEKFLRGQPNGVATMAKLSAAEKLVRRKSRTSRLPNFYTMPTLPPILSGSCSLSRPANMQAHTNAQTVKDDTKSNGEKQHSQTSSDKLNSALNAALLHLESVGNRQDIRANGKRPQQCRSVAPMNPRQGSRAPPQPSYSQSIEAHSSRQCTRSETCEYPLHNEPLDWHYSE